MGFRDLNIPLSIKTTSSDPIQEFFNPVLEKAIRYDVAVGYFSSLWIRDAAAGIAKFACNNGRARWIISPEISKDDYKAIKGDDGLLKPNKIELLIQKSFAKLYDELKNNTRTALAWLIVDRVMEFRVAIPKNELSGIMHAKMGIFKDTNNDEIGFSGSYNLTRMAANNWEKIEIYCGWKTDESLKRIETIKLDFDTMWQERDSNLAVFKPSDRALEKFIKRAKNTTRPYDIKKKTFQQILVPEKFLVEGNLRPYQQKAIDSWFKNNGKGIFNMATGSGKTVTSLAAVARLCNYVIEKRSKVAIIVTVPYKHLADQWATEAAEFGFEVVVCYDKVELWMPKVQMKLLNFVTGESKYIFFITVNDTFSNPPFQKILKKINETICFVADEMHNLGAPRLLKVLPEKARFRLGLSATPVRSGDEQGTKGLQQFFGPQVIEFGLKEAIDHGFLCQYYYYPIIVHLTENEMEEYIQISQDISRAYIYHNEDNDGPNDKVMRLLIKRARLIGKAQNKLNLLISMLSERKESAYNIIYCGDASDSDERHVEKTLRLIGTQVRMRVNKFTSDETPTERRHLLDQFSKGDIQTLVAIRCLDEGVDVPKTETAYILSSSTNPRQFIQRRGRVLRRAPGKKTANIYDFVTIPDIDMIKSRSSKIFNIERQLVKRELQRVNEFAELSINHGNALKTLRDIKKKLHLLDS